MRQLIYTLAIIIASGTTSIFAQTDFAPSSADWYHTMTYGVFHSYYSHDTTIAGQPCRKVMRKALTANPWLSMGLTVYDLQPLYFYNTADTVFVYNTLFNRFTPVYVYNVNAGDTVTLPVLPPQPGALNFSSTDSTFTFVVDSVGIALYDTTMLKTVYTRSLGLSTTGKYTYNYGAQGDTTGAYARNIGCIQAGLLPRCIKCAFVLSDAVQSPGELRCYNDPYRNVQLVTGICGKDYTSVDDPNTGDRVVIYPNPADEVIKIASANGKSLQITDMQGRVMYNIDKVTGVAEINTALFSAGLYLMRIVSPNKPQELRRITISHN